MEAILTDLQQIDEQSANTDVDPFNSESS